MTSEDIRCEEEGRPGLFMLKKWLEYSATGKIESEVHTRKEPDSDFERYVIRQIVAMGCEAVPQVGISGYFIDIGIRPRVGRMDSLWGLSAMVQASIHQNLLESVID